jgi:hypothetical protein
MGWKIAIRWLGALAFVFLASEALAQAPCEAVPVFDGDDVIAVTVTCGPGQEATGFATSYGDTTYDGNGDDIVIISGGQVVSTATTPPLVDDNEPLHVSCSCFIDLLDGNNTFIMTGGQVGSPGNMNTVIYFGNGDNRFLISGGAIYGNIAPDGEEFYDIVGSNEFRISGTAYIPGKIWTGLGDNSLIMTGGYLGEIQFEDGNDTVQISGGRLAELVILGGVNHVMVSGSAQIGPSGGEQAAVDFLGGTNTFIMTGGRVDGWISGGEGSDYFEISGGTVSGSIIGSAGGDTLVMRGGTVGGDISAEHVELYGGTIGGDIYNLSSSTLIIDDGQSATPLSLQDGVTFSGFDGVAIITNTDLAKFDGGSFQSQNFLGFSDVTLSNSTLGFSGPQEIDQLTLNNGSTLHVDSDVPLLSQSSGLGNLILANSSLNMIDGSLGDSFQVGDLILDNARIGLDVNQTAGQADQIFVGGLLTLNGANIVQVNLLDTPTLNQTAQIPILLGAAPTGSGNFVVGGVPGTIASLFNYEIVSNLEGLFLLATPGDLSPVMAPKAVDPQTVTTALDAIDDVLNDAMEFNMGLIGGGGAAGIADAPTVGIFASGQWARVSHDGFTVKSNHLSGLGPAFTANDFSAILSLDFNAAKHFAFDDRYGLNLGLFGGYTSTDVTLDSFLGFPTIGNASNESGMVGAYGLFRKGFSYVLVSGTTFVGETDVVHGVLGTTGNYDTVGYAVTATTGRIFALSDTVRFDLRGGILGVSFTGDPYSDSGGNNFGKSRISFGAIKFEPGIYSEHRLENGMIFSPYARGELQQRFGYRNTGSVEGMTFDFDDSDFSASLSGGFNLKVSDSTTMSGEVRGKASSDTTTIAGKIGLKVAF